MPEIQKVPSGIRGLDELTGGGLPAGRPTLVCGGPGCGKTLLAMTFLVKGARDYREPGVFVSFDERIVDLAANVSSLGFDLVELQEQKLIAMDHVVLDRQAFQETGEYDLEGLFVRLGHAINRVEAKRVVLDSIDSLFAGIPNAAVVRSELVRLFNWLKERGLSTIVTAERGETGLTRHGVEEYVSDCVIVLDHRVIEQLSTRRLRVVKYRGSAHGTNEYPFLIGRRGITVFPVTSLGLAQIASAERVSTGMADLDKMLEGKGFYKGSSVLLGGGAGTGKTSIAAHFVEAACRRGERCVFFSFEESPSQPTRNMRSLGIDLQPWIESGLLRCHSTRPSLHGLEPHLASMLEEIDDYRPHVTVVDPLSALLASGTQHQTQGMLLRLIDHLKTNGVTALFTTLQTEDDLTHLSISSIMDTWIRVLNEDVDDDVVRQLHVVKSRGMAHSTKRRVMEITEHGVRLKDEAPKSLRSQ
ncbi:circadian clock protein KaiC [Methylocystis heyeri]|nr:circadian clock protein KaiC [Methylocystis heyeri]